MKRKHLLITGVTILIVLLTVGVGILTSYVSNFINPVFRPFALPSLVIIALIVASLTVWLYFLQRDTNHLVPTLGNQYRQRMLAKVRSFWIAGVLEQSLYCEVLIVLRLGEQPEAVANPWQFVLQQPDQTARLLPSGTRITDVYDDAGGELLILGEPGAGKTTLLLELARDLLDRAQKDDTHPIPVVFKLSSWAVKRQAIASWLVEELNTRYQVPPPLSQAWIDTDQIMPLLDGLDEVFPDYRTECVEAINSYRQKHGLAPIVVCSRSTEYLIQARRLQLRNAVVLQPLTTQQIDDYLASAGGKLEALCVTLRGDPALQALATAPLMLSVLTLTYRGMQVDTLLPAWPPTTRRQQVFISYTQRMLQQEHTHNLYPPQQTINRLMWLAWQMERHRQAEFYIEQITSDWLPDNRLYLFSRGIAITLLKRFFLGLLCALSVGLLGLLSVRLPYPLLQGLLSPASLEILDNQRGTLFLFTLILSLLGGLAVGIFPKLLHDLYSRLEPVKGITWSWVRMREKLVATLGNTAPITFRIYCGLLIGFAIFWLIDLWPFMSFNNIGVLDIISEFLLGIGYIMLLVIFVGLVGLPVLVMAWLLISFSVSGFVYYTLDEHKLAVPNHWTRRSALNSLLVGCFAGLLAGVIAGSLGGLSIGLLFGLPLGLGVELFSGGVAYIDQVVLRVLLSRAGQMPWNYSGFLDYTTRRLLLRKVGGGYMFIHRLLQEHFELLYTMKIYQDAAEQVQQHSPPATR